MYSVYNRKEEGVKLADLLGGKAKRTKASGVLTTAQKKKCIKIHAVYNQPEHSETSPVLYGEIKKDETISQGIRA